MDTLLLLHELRSFVHDAGFGDLHPMDQRSSVLTKKIDDLLAQRPRIVCLCGSTRFFPRFMEANYRETMAGRVVLSVGFYPHASEEAHGEAVGITSEQKEKLDQLHLRKIDLADEILVLNQDGYVGESTAREVLYATSTGKDVRWLEPELSKSESELRHIARRLLTGDGAEASPVAP